MICNGIAGGNRFDSLDMKIEWVREKRATLIVKVKAARTPARKPWPKKKKIKKRRYPKGI